MLHLLKLATIFVLTTACCYAEDWRMTVQLPNQNGKVSLPNLNRALLLSQPALLNKIIPAEFILPENFRLPVSSIARVQPSKEFLTVIYRASSVFKVLEQMGIPAIRTPPSLHIEIQLINQAGRRMVETENMLAAQLPDILRNVGVQQTDHAPTLLLKWTWVDYDQVMQTVRGTSSLEESVDFKTLLQGDPAITLLAPLTNILLAARDASLHASNAPIDIPVEFTRSNSVLLTVKRTLSLPAQVEFETTLRQHRSVASLQPVRLARGSQTYALHLHPQGNRRLENTLREKGWVLFETANGWVIR